VRGFLERMICALRFVELIAAILAFVTKVCEVNGELAKQLGRAAPAGLTDPELQWLAGSGCWRGPGMLWTRRGPEGTMSWRGAPFVRDERRF
jgi:hypothetical protein